MEKPTAPPPQWPSATSQSLLAHSLFDEWWGALVFRDLRRSSFTRRDLTLALANKEGGAHVDPELEPGYAALSRNGSLGWVLVDDAGERQLLESPVPASVRLIAHEVERTLA